MMIKRLKIAMLSAALPLATISATQAAVTLNFVIPGQTAVYQEILNYYDGGASQEGQIGPNYGITFGSDALALENAPESNVGNEPAPGGNSMIFLSGAGDIMDVAAGFNTGFSFYYAAPYYSGSVTVYSGLDGTGSILATLPLTINGAGPGPGNYSNWSEVGVSFLGTAESVNFSGNANYIAFTDVTIGSANALTSNSVPDNGGASLYMLAGLTLAGAAWASRKQVIA